MLERLGVSAEDLAYLASRGKSQTDLSKELQALSKEAQTVDVQDAAHYDNGFLYRLQEGEYKALIEAYPERVQGKSLAVFVPAAGAASRQFQMLKTLLHHPLLAKEPSISAVLQCAEGQLTALAAIPQEQCTDAHNAERKQLQEVTAYLRRFWDDGIVQRRFAFVDAIKDIVEARGYPWKDVLAQEQFQPVCQAILSREEGLGYAWLPKALLAFHAYPHDEGSIEVRTALEEHIRAVVRLHRESQVRLHLALSEEHEAPLQEALQAIMASPSMQSHLAAHGVDADALSIDWSFQAASTDAVALDLASGQLAREPDGTPILRKAGHGALLSNIAALDVDGLWIQNVDNILYENPAALIAVHGTKQLMASLALIRQTQIHALLNTIDEHQKKLAHETSTPASLEEEMFASLDASLHASLCAFVRHQLTLQPIDPRLQPDSLAQGYQAKEIFDVWHKLLDRPLVVAGYVPLQPKQKGGGPFVLAQSLDGLLVHKTNTVEGAELAGGQSHPLFQSGICFNPVNLFIATRRYDGSRFDLTQFADEQRFFSAEKTDALGQPIKVYEKPGLWNGALAKALQISIGILAHTFSAVKDVAGPESFLSPLHQPGDIPIVTPLDIQRGIVTADTARWLESLLTAEPPSIITAVSTPRTK